MNAVEFNNVTFAYKSNTVFSECSLSIPAGRTVGLIGSNGAGKSTLLQLLAGLLQPVSGSVTILDAGSPGRNSARLATAFVAQEALLYENLRVKDMIRVAKLLNAEFDETTLGELSDLGIGLRQRVKDLSGGQLAQLSLRLALARRARLLLLDEPLSDLDPLARLDFIGTVMESVSDNEQTVIFSSHDLAELDRCIDYVVILAGGQIELIGDLDEILSEHWLVRATPGQLDEVYDASCVFRNLGATVGEHLIRTKSRNAIEALDARPALLDDVVLGYLRRGRSVSRIRDMAARS